MKSVNAVLEEEVGVEQSAVQAEQSECLSWERKSLYLDDIRIDKLCLSDLLIALQRACKNQQGTLILNHNLHSLYLYKENYAFRSLYSKASHVYVDGMAVIWLARLARLDFGVQHRITFLDCFDELLQLAVAARWKVYYLGSSQRVLTEGLEILRSRIPGLNIKGHHGHFDKRGCESDDVIHEINVWRPDLLFVGMGMPTQEEWLEDNLHRIKASAILTSGGTLDYQAGAAYKPPRWAGSIGLYGVARMLSDPNRLWKRYLVEPVFVLSSLTRFILRERFRTKRVGVCCSDSGSLEP